MRPIRLRCEYLTDPLGIGEREPRLFWWLDDDRQGARQIAYHLQAASTRDGLLAGEADCWDTGRVAGDAQTHVVYAGTPLRSRAQVYWRVRGWDQHNQPGPWSDPARFELGLLDRDDWSASWITTAISEPGLTTPPAGLLRTTFTLQQPVAQARLYVTALGLYDAHLNGQRIGEDWLRPGWTDYRVRLQVQTYDVTRHLQPGANALAVVLGDGWYSGRVAHLDRGLLYGQQPALLAQLEITAVDGTVTRVVSGPDWRWCESPIRRQDLLDGEDYDARRVVPGWDTPQADPDLFQPVHARVWPELQLEPPPNEPVRVLSELPPVSDPEPVDAGWERDAFVFDLGQNMAGVVRLRVRGPRGATVRLRYGEMRQADGQLYTANLRSARAIDTYTLAGDPDGETWSPRFTFHGFRFVEVSYHRRWRGQIAPFERDTVTGLVLGSAPEQSGTFACSDPLVNQLFSNIRWGQRGNFLEVPTDCPQRDERLGWTGDAQVFMPTAAFLANVAPLISKWLRDCDDAQRPDGRMPMIVPRLHEEDDGGPGWSDARVIVPWELFRAYGDVRLLERHYPAMVRWLEWQAATAREGVRCFDGCGHWPGFSDWLALDNGWQAVIGATPRDLIGTAHFARSAGLMARIADELGRPDDVARFSGWRRAAEEAFAREYLAPDGGLRVATQTACLLALAWELVPKPARAAVFDQLQGLLAERDWHLSTGFLGTPLLCAVLTDYGRPDLAQRVFLQTDYPGWLFPVRNGATTMWERWNSWTPEHGFGDVGMNSFNHYAAGAVGRWLVDTVGGLALDDEQPAYRHVLIRPQPAPALTWAETEHDSLYGRLRVRWQRADGAFRLSVRVPPNVTGTVVMPDGSRHAIAAGIHDFECLPG